MLQYTVVENTVVKYNKNREEYYTIPMYSTNAIEIKFILDDSWKEYVITAQISNGEKTYNLLLENNTAFIPADITAGIWNVSIFGVKGEEKRNTTIPSDFCVVEEGFKSDGQPPIPPEPDLYQKLLSEIQKGIEIAQSVKNDADAGKFDGENGNGIERIELVNKIDKVTTYKIIFTDGEEFEYQITDGTDGINGVDGITPTIGENGNWFIGDTDTGKPARGEKGEKGEQGIQGVQGIVGQDGITPDISINATVNNNVGTPSVSVEKTGTTENPVFNLSFENLKGEQGLQGEHGEQGVAGVNGADGKSATITIGTVTTVSPDTPASVTNTGTATDAVFNFEIPKGQDGENSNKSYGELLLAEYEHQGNQEIYFSSFDWEKGIGECTNPHGLTQTKKIMIVPNDWWKENFLQKGLSIPVEWCMYSNRLFVSPVDETHLKVLGGYLESSASEEMPVNVDDPLNVNLDCTQFHFEIGVPFELQNFPVKPISIRATISGFITGGSAYRYLNVDVMTGDGKIISGIYNQLLGVSKFGSLSFPYHSLYQVFETTVDLTGTDFVLFKSASFVRGRRAKSDYADNFLGEKFTEEITSVYYSSLLGQTYMEKGLKYIEKFYCGSSWPIYANHSVVRLFAKAVLDE